jgi:beta-glucosidase
MTPILTRALLVALGVGTASNLARAEEAVYKDRQAPVEARVQDALGRMTQEEKLQILGGERDLYIKPIARLGIPGVRMSDGPQGVRCYGPSTAYPATISLGASWDPDLAREFGASMGSDARARGVGIMLAPAVNINRVPQNGRNFEYLSEDPYLAGSIAAQIVVGLQSQGVAATVKHFAANNQETERGTIDARVSERALREIYLPAFEAAVKQGHVWAVMDAYNRLNGTYCSANDWLNNRVLKEEWGFKGVLMSDWGAAHDTLGVANGGLDLEMPSGIYMNPATLGPLLASGKVSQATIDEKVRRILRLEIANGFLDRPAASNAPMDDPRSDLTALKIAREAIVLLKNDRSLLPLSGKKIKHIVVLGPNAEANPAGGGSGHVGPFHYVSLVEGLRKAAGSKVHVDLIGGPDSELLERVAKTSSYGGSLKLEFSRKEGEGSRVIATLQDGAIDHDFGAGSLAPGVTAQDLSARWTGTIRPPAAGKYLFMLQNHGNALVQLDGRDLITDWFNTGDTRYAYATLEANRSYALVVASVYDNVGSPAVRFGWCPAPELIPASDVAKVRAADAVIVSAGFNAATEGEGTDRSFDLPAEQRDLILQAASLNPRTVVVINSGGVVGTEDWISRVPAVVQAWYPGQEGGRALGEILTGKVSPSGKLPISYAKRFEDTAPYGNYPGAQGKVDYAEGILVGYRWFDTRGVAPLFPFGHGLSYTTFSYAKLHVEPSQDGRWAVIFDVTNNGTMNADEVSQVYVSPPVTSKAHRPVRELRGFSRESLATDQTITVTIVLDRKAFSYFDESKADWVVEPGSYTIEVGSSSRKILLALPVEVD